MNQKLIWKKALTGLMAVVLLLSVLSLFACGGSGDGETTAARGEAATFTVKIAHTNDIHARVEADDTVIGMERLKTIFDQHLQDADLGLTLDSGDLLHGQSIATLVKGESVARLVRACGYDAMSPGNHDWNYTKDRLPELEEMAGMPILGGNVLRPDGSRFFANEFLIKEVKKGDATLRVGVMGMIDEDVYTDTAPANVEGITFSAVETYAKEASARLRDTEDCDIVIALGHISNPMALAERIDGVDLWLCGHDHMSISEAVTTPDGTKSYVVEDGQHLEEVGLVGLTVDMNAEGEVTEIAFQKTSVTYEDAASYEKDPAVSKLLGEIKSETSAILDRVVGTIPMDFNGERQAVRTSQTNLGTAVASAYIKATGADIAFENGGGIRASLSKGDITYGDVISVSPFGNYLVTKQLSGKAIRSILEQSLEFRARTVYAYEHTDPFVDPACSGTSLHFAGMTVVCDMDAAMGSRVLSVTVGGEPMDDDKLYVIATNNYVAGSTDYVELGEAPELGQYSACEEALIEFFKQDAAAIEEAVSADPLILK